MPIIKSAIKRVRVEARRQKRNTITKNRYKELVKEFTALIGNGKTDEAAKLFPIVQKSLDMAVKKNLLHKNNVARKKSSLAKMLGNKPAANTETKPAAKKAPAKKEA
ncbi:30S ribosomal protein S20 [bacterium]|nr:30S ribosomal protein S20 [bacterium]NCQ55504.1 30S ribosomal protein S20 [Candidatus Parcubacteria bacterium]NCS67515.1 30S ribosomal protein S20 [Candidatus Peregrinibacteria bacterium]NCS96320.1 30S ribosomal protein S20 [bacterium]